MNIKSAHIIMYTMAESVCYHFFSYFRIFLHCKYIDRKYYDILLCLIYHRNLVVICTADGRIQPMIVPSTTIPWFQPLVVVCQSRFIVDIGIKEKYRIQC